MSHNIVTGVIGVILIAFVGAMVIGSLPDPNREAINALPDTNPDIKTPVNNALDIKDQAETAADNAVFWKNFAKVFLLIGIPVSVVGGLAYKYLS